MSMNFNFNSIGSLFGGSSGSSSGMSSFLGDYASIKNGSYGKLLRAYYKESGTDSVKGASSTKKSEKSVAEKIIEENIKRSQRKESAESKAYTAVKSATDKLGSSMSKLTDTSSDLFDQKLITRTDENGVETTEFGYDKEAIYSALNDFVSNYNTLLSKANATNNTSIVNRAASISNETKTYEKTLNQIGVSINADGTLSINKDNFLNADMRKVQELFQDTAYVNGVSTSSSLIYDTANYEQLRADMYTYDGTYENAYKSGTSFNSSL